MLELFLCLTRETDDAVGRDACVGHERPDAIDDLHVLFHRVAPPHGLEDIVVAALEGHVEALDNVGALGDGVDDSKGHVAGVRGDEADALDLGHL